MENTNPAKDNRIIVAVLVLMTGIVFVVAVVSFFSGWNCNNGQWVKRGFPLSGSPEGGCGMALQSPLPKQNDSGKQSESEILPKEETVEVAGEIYKSEKDGLEVYSPGTGALIKSPLTIVGRAKSHWYFEGSFPVKLMDGKGNVFAETYADAEDEWMDKEWVEFESKLEFSVPAPMDGYILFEWDNPSGLSQNDFTLSLPVKIANNPSAEKVPVSPHISSQCGHDPKDDPILGDCGEDCDTSNWKIYKNKKYGYSFRYDPSFKLAKDCKDVNCIKEEQGGDVVFLEGDLSEKGWPMIEIRHLQNEHYNPPPGTATGEWVREKFSWTQKCLPNSANIYFTGEDGRLFGGLNIYFPAGPGVYSRREIYYSYKGKIFEIVMLDVDESQARQFYDIWLSTFSVLGES